MGSVIFYITVVILIFPAFSGNLFGVIPIIPLLWGIIITPFYPVRNFQAYTPGFKWFLCFGVAVVLSQLNALRPSETFMKSVVFMFFMATIPLMGMFIKRYIKVTHFIVYSVLINIFHIVYSFLYATELSRAGVTVFGPLELNQTSVGIILYISVLIIYPLIWNYKYSNFKRFLILSLLIANIYTLMFYIGNRSGILAIFFGVYFYHIFKSTKTPGSKLKLILIPLISIFLFVESVKFLSYNGYLPEYIQARVERTFSPEQDSSGMARVANFIKGVEMFSDFPVVGGGYLNFIYYSYDIKVDVVDVYGYVRKIGKDNIRPHSLYITLIGETGILGIITFVLLSRWIFIQITKMAKGNRENIILDCTWCWLPGWYVFSFFHDGFSTFTYLYIAFFYAGLLWMYEIKEDTYDSRIPLHGLHFPR